ncbi:Mitogen-activated protein kinase SLT2/MPK1 [Sparassis crispa]|uniref:Mitogen-activated protein kinase SLT2/MPK1 n=1 Tax=Sparassis crispa TaxID=139825 RepID=A0A401GWG7_9APHY|nr:Mitogen-activated protein kinase SLT2/MPK1 [Sparassis crispa]GBE86566.1 Mitogen-activated protein kinase SLT2/MPK1 [Sparassis crispa]
MVHNSPEQSGARPADQSDQPTPPGDKPAEESNGHNKQESSSSAPSPSSSNGRRGRSRTRNSPRSRPDDNFNRRGYHTLMSSFGRAFHVEKRWKLIRELGSGAYGFVISAADEISGEPVAIKMVTRATEKIQLAKRALREITLLRHFAHENITGLIDVDCTPDLSEIYIFMEPMEADLHQIIKSGQTLTDEHVQYFVYQILRGMKFIHSASVIHRDLKPGNLLVNADCELKICDFGLSRGFNSAPDENPTAMTEYVATRWYRAPEIMLAYKGYNIAIDVWSIGCIFAELMLGRPLFKGKDYVDQLNQILQVLGTPDDQVISRIGSPKAQAYIRSLPIKKTVPFSKVIPTADPQAVDLLTKMLTFDPASRITVAEALEHPWLSSYHDVGDEPTCPEKFGRWTFIEGLETLDQFREALWNEIQDYRREVRSVGADERSTRSPSLRGKESEISPEKADRVPSPHVAAVSPEKPVQSPEATETAKDVDWTAKETNGHTNAQVPEPGKVVVEEVDPVVTYARRSSFMAPARPSRTNSTYSNYSSSQFRSHQPATSTDGASAHGGESSVVFPGQQDYVVPARSRTASMYGGSVSRRLLRTLSTVSIYESGEGFAGGLADIAPIGRYIVERDEALPSGMPHELESPPQGTTQKQTQAPGDSTQCKE